MTPENGISIPLHKPKMRELLFFLLSGVLVSVPLTLFISQFSDILVVSMPPFYATVVSIVVLAPLIEEFSKAYPLFYRHGETERSLFILGFLVGAGFGLAEFVEYVVLFNASVLLRLPGILFHASTTSIVAFGIAKKNITAFYALAVTLHLANNFIAVLGPIGDFGGIIFIIAAYVLSWFLYTRTVERMIPF
jgi:hypothetical protein